MEDGAFGPGQREAAVLVGSVLDPGGVHQPAAGLVLLCLHHPAVRRICLGS